MYWLTGYDTFGFCFFQCLVVDGRRPDGAPDPLRGSAAGAAHLDHRRTSASGRTRADANPALDLQGPGGAISALPASASASNTRATASSPRTARSSTPPSPASPTLEDASPARDAPAGREVGRGDRLCARGRRARRRGRRRGPRADPGRRRRGRDPGRPARRDLPRRRRLSGQRVHHRLRPRTRCSAATSPAGACSTSSDQITLEFAGAYRRYHAAIMRTVPVGDPRPPHLAYHRAAREALLACEAEMSPAARRATCSPLTPGSSTARPDEHRLNACGYSLGARYTPSWMDWPMFYEGNPWVIEPGMVLFAHMILMDSDTDTAMCLGRTSIVARPEPSPSPTPSPARPRSPLISDPAPARLPRIVLASARFSDCLGRTETAEPNIGKPLRGCPPVTRISLRVRRLRSWGRPPRPGRCRVVLRGHASDPQLLGLDLLLDLCWLQGLPDRRPRSAQRPPTRAAERVRAGRAHQPDPTLSCAGLPPGTTGRYPISFDEASRLVRSTIPLCVSHFTAVGAPGQRRYRSTTTGVPTRT